MSITSDRIRVALAVLLALCIGYAGARLFGFPADVGFNASILRQPSPIVAILGAAVTFGVASLAALPIVRRVHAEAAIAVGAVALARFSWRGGTISPTLIEAGEKGVYLALALEVVVLFGIALALWFALRRFIPTSPTIQVDPKTEQELLETRAESLAPEPLDQKLLASATQIVVMIACMVILCRSKDKVQVFASVFFSSMLASWAAHRFISVRPGVWYWMGPMAVALLGYVSGFFAPTGLLVGDPGHYFAALARPLPLDYLAAGIAGSAWGYAMREAHREKAVLLVKQQAVATS